MLLKDWIEEQRKAAKLSSYELSKKLSRSISSVVGIETGRKMYVTTNTAKKLCQIFGGSIKDFKRNRWIKDREKHCNAT